MERSKPRKYKIAIILPHFYPYVGGAEKMFYDLAVKLASAGHRVHVVAEKVDDEHDGRMEFDGIKVWYCRWASAFGHPIPRQKDIERHIKWCNIVHTSIFTTAPVVSRLAERYHKPSVLTVYEMRGFKWFFTDSWYRAGIYFLVEQYSCRQKFDAYHAISDATAADMKKYAQKKDVHRVYLANELGNETQATSSFSLREYFGLKDEFIFLYYGRPGKTKGVQVYEKALEILKKRGALSRKIRYCFILGKEPAGPRKDFLRSLKKAGLSGYVLIRGSVEREDLAEAIKQADCVVVPSLTEGFGFSALEACQSGARLICSDAGSLPEVVYGDCAVFKNRDSEDLADKLEAAAAGDKDIFRKIPEKKFTYDAMFDGIMEIYEGIIK